ncbi:unnamed protein product, partial [marine sediment metagenome]
GRSNLWDVVDTGEQTSFPECPWAIDLRGKPFPDDEKKALGQWFWESGFDHDPIEKGEHIRDTNFRAMYGAWDALKNAQGKYPNHRLNWAAHISGKRESRRLLGDVILERDDFTEGKEYEDVCVPTSWTIDLHYPNETYEKAFEEEAFISRADFGKYERPYWVPYRCLYSRNTENLFMAGRNISVTHEALGAVRVMKTTGMMGEVVGIAAHLCKKHESNPRGIHEHHLSALQELMKQGVGRKTRSRNGNQ